MKESKLETLIAALWILVRDIRSDDGLANAAIAEAAERLKQQQATIEILTNANRGLSQEIAKLKAHLSPKV